MTTPGARCTACEDAPMVEWGVAPRCAPAPACTPWLLFPRWLGALDGDRSLCRWFDASGVPFGQREDAQERERLPPGAQLARLYRCRPGFDQHGERGWAVWISVDEPVTPGTCARA